MGPGGGGRKSARRLRRHRHQSRRQGGAGRLHAADGLDRRADGGFRRGGAGRAFRRQQIFRADHRGGGIGAASHLSGALFEKDAKIEMLHVPYKGTGPAVTDLLGGRIDMMFSPSTTVQAFVESGKLKALAVTGAKRSKFFPKVPTVAEGGLPGYASVGWFGLLAPAHTPPEIVDKLNKAVVAIMATPDVKDHMAKFGAEPEPQSPEEFARYINADVAKWSALVKEQNITIPGAGK